MNVTETIENRIKSFKASSFFTAGDPYSFSVALDDEFKLPGKYDPKDYMSRLDLELEGKNVLVVCPGNSGLCVEAIHAGAALIVGLEPRHLYHRPMTAIAEFADELIGTTFIHRTGDANLVEKFDVVIWAEGVDDIPHPKEIFNKVFDSIVPGGKFCLEIGHGTHGVLPLTTNCWKPTAEALVETVSSYGDYLVTGKIGGRNQTRKIYTIINNEQVTIEVLAGKDFSSIEEVREYADELKATMKSGDTALDISVHTPKVGAEEDLDSVYDYVADDHKEASTPKSQAKKNKDAAEASRKPEKRAKKDKPQA